MNAKRMTYKELENKVVSNRVKMRTATTEEKRVLVKENFECMKEMDARWN